MRQSILKVTAGGILLFAFAILSGQGSFHDLVMNAFGLDQDLVNGVQYYYRYFQTEGHPYFLEDRFNTGSVTINGRVFQNVKLKYDLYSQHVEIEYEFLSGGSNLILAVPEHMSAFTIGKYNFRKLKLTEVPERFYQVIHNARFTCFIYWEKKLVPYNNNTVYLYHFTNPENLYYLELDGEIKAFNNRRTFVKLFPEGIQKRLMKHLRQLDVSFRSTNPDEIIRTINSIATLYNTESHL
ncbi:MAG: hypothetical protein AMS27_01360 [Bacteroides sp. SM23_62_1]|nr:MAG: hypothetical protein AMS27_01360 [Bacteroides sp. SM23_62_1]